MDWSLQSFQSDKTGPCEGYCIRVLTYIPGQTFVQTPYVQGSFYNVGQFIGQFHKATQGFQHDFYDNDTFLWSVTSVPRLRQFVHAVADKTDVEMILEILTSFENKIVPAFGKFTQGIIHQDISEQNLIMREMPNQENVPSDARVHEVTAILDFAHVAKSFTTWDIAISTAYLSIECPDEGQLDVAGHILAGYYHYFRLNPSEFAALKLLICSRLCQSLVIGAHAHLQQPDNPYVLSTSERGWPLIRKLWHTDSDKLIKRWAQIIDSYCI